MDFFTIEIGKNLVNTKNLTEYMLNTCRDLYNDIHFLLDKLEFNNNLDQQNKAIKYSEIADKILEFQKTPTSIQKVFSILGDSNLITLLQEKDPNNIFIMNKYADLNHYVNLCEMIKNKTPIKIIPSLEQNQTFTEITHIKNKILNTLKNNS
ncbi:MAG: hypothetical protein N2645_22560 [Clostridia bacterium]|nr:hypothetical protein [Clostridia bacterium]